jgi:hypothetical protein
MFCSLQQSINIHKILTAKMEGLKSITPLHLESSRESQKVPMAKIFVSSRMENEKSNFVTFRNMFFGTVSSLSSYNFLFTLKSTKYLYVDNK